MLCGRAICCCARPMKALMAEVIIVSLRRMNTVETLANSGGRVWQRMAWRTLQFSAMALGSRVTPMPAATHERMPSRVPSSMIWFGTRPTW
ncbi:hypothetical protein D3C81_1936410 [compost metagenome]